jgi:hypothetical protein
MEETKITEAVSEIKGASEEEIKAVIEKWFESTRTAGMKIGATYLAAAVYGVIEKNLKKNSKPSLRDYQRAVKRIVEIVSVQLTQQNDSEEVTEEEVNDGTAE